MVGRSTGWRKRPEAARNSWCRDHRPQSPVPGSSTLPCSLDKSHRPTGNSQGGRGGPCRRCNSQSSRCPAAQSGLQHREWAPATARGSSYRTGRSARCCSRSIQRRAGIGTGSPTCGEGTRPRSGPPPPTCSWRAIWQAGARGGQWADKTAAARPLPRNTCRMGIGGKWNWRSSRRGMEAKGSRMRGRPWRRGSAMSTARTPSCLWMQHRSWAMCPKWSSRCSPCHWKY